MIDRQLPIRLFLAVLTALCSIGAYAQNGAAGEDNAALRQYLSMQRRMLNVRDRAHKNDNAEALRENDSWARSLLMLDKARRVVFDPYFGAATKREKVVGFRRVFDRELAAVRKGKAIERPLAGTHELAYIAPQDGSAQPFVVHVPEAAAGKMKAGKRVPLVLFLHGYVSYMNKINWYEELSRPDALLALAEKKGFVVALPFGRSNTEFMGIGEVDVLRVYDEVVRRYAIDEDRVFLSGISMGGSGAWTVAAHYPHRFAGVLAIAGRTDYYLWKGLDPGRIPPHHRFLTDINYVAALPQNFRGMGVYVSHGRHDHLVKAAQSSAMVDRLKKHGVDPVMEFVDQGGHYVIWSHAFMQPRFEKWLEENRRDRWPRRIAYKTYSPKYGRAYWATVERFATFGEPATIDVQVTAPNTIKIESTNVARLRLALDPKALKLRGKIVFDAGPLKPVRPVVMDDIAKVVYLFRPKANIVGNGPVKDHGAAPGPGPIAEAYNGPFVMVYGASEDPKADNPSRRLAELNAAHWFRYAKGIPEIKPHTALKPEDLKTKNLILFGTAETNPLIAKVYQQDPDFPLQVQGDTIAVGEKTYKGDDLGAIVIRPNPLNPTKYVVIHSGVPWGMALEVNHRFDFLPDFIVYQAAIDPDDTNHALCAGFFGNRWQMQEETTWTFERRNEPAAIPGR